MNTIVLIAEGTATLLATWYYYKYKDTSFRFLLPYLWVMLAMENANHILEIPDFWQFVRWNLFTILRCLLFFWMFQQEIRQPRLRSIITFFTILMIALYVGEFVVQGAAGIYNLTHFTGDLLGIVVIALYAVDLFARPQIHTLHKDIVSWISVCFLVFFASFPVLQTAKLMYYGQEPLFTNILWILTAIIVLMYSILSFGFIWSEKRY